MKKIPFHSRALINAVIFNGVFASAAWAADPRQLDLDIFIVDENASPAEVINRIELPPPASLNPSAIGGDQRDTDVVDTDIRVNTLDEIETTVDDTLESATRTVTDTINDAISSGDLEALPVEVDELIPDEEIDKIIDSIDTGLIDELTGDADAVLDDAANVLEPTAPALPNDLLLEQTIEDALDDLEAVDEDSMPDLPDLDEAARDLPEPDTTLEDLETDSNTDLLPGLRN